MRFFINLAVGVAFAIAGAPAAQNPPEVNPATLLQVKRIFVAPFTGGVKADALRELIMSSLDSTKLYVLTENSDRADAILKGAADDETFTDSHHISDSASGRGGSSISSGGYYSKTGSSVSEAGSERESYSIKERKHEAYAAVRLCNKDGDVLWSTTQESLGAKFRGASADVAAKVARQLTIDYEKARRGGPRDVSATAGH